MNPAVEQYLAELEAQLRRVPGVAVQQTLQETREFMESALAEDPPKARAPGAGDREFARLVARFGTPAEIAAAYRDDADRAPARPLGHAPGWQLQCTRCGRSVPAADVGFSRIGAFAWMKFLLGICRQCHALRVLRLTRSNTARA